jgi:hypothetical protein
LLGQAVGACAESIVSEEMAKLVDEQKIITFHFCGVMFTSSMT